MKKVNKLRVAVLLMISVFLHSCQNQDDVSYEVFEITTEVDTSKLINFKGLPVNHRFETPVKNLEIEHNENNLKKMFSQMKQKVAQKKGLIFKNNNDELPDAEIILEGAKEVIHKFPYPEIEEEYDYITQELDSTQIAELEKKYQIEQEQIAQEKWNMIKQDFPTLTEQEIKNHIETIEEYYEQNFDYEILNEIANNEEKIANKISLNKTYLSNSDSCLTNLLENLGLYLIGGNISIIKATIALVIVGKSPQKYAEEYYGETDGGSNTRGDAYRHTIWNALLANNYFTIVAKWKRKLFAKQITDLYESCTGGDADSKTMDYHNNAIGRKIWDDNTSHRKFWGIPYALRRPSTAKLKDLVREAVNEKSCFIVKFKSNDSNDFPNNLLTQTQTISQIKAKIDNTNSNTTVYFAGTIAPSRYTYRYIFSHWEYYDCGGDLDIINIPQIIEPIEECKKAIYKRERVEIKACYKL